MLILIKTILISGLAWLALLSSTTNTLKLTLIFEILWISLFSLLILLGLLTADSLFFIFGLFTFVLSAAEIVLLLSMVYFKN